MKEHYHKVLDETFFEKVLANGLTVRLVPKPGYHRSYGILTTHYGSVDQVVRHKQTGEEKTIPAGAAHFLEHKMFEGQGGLDAFALFMKQGAMANAFTHYFQTSYLFSASYYIERNVETLLDFVQTPYFTSEGIEKEKGIITQELYMYQDDPLGVSYQALHQALYPDHPLGVDILGTEESIKATTYEDLRLAYDTFYHPSNMNLIVVGNFDPQALLAVIEANQARKTFEPPRYHRVEEEVTAPVLPKTQLEREISQPIIELAWRFSPQKLSGLELIRQRIIGEVFFELLMGPMSSAYASWYQQQWVDTNFYQSYHLDHKMHHLAIHAQSHHTSDLIAAIKELLANWQHNPDLTEEQLKQVVTGRIGDFLQHLNSLEFIAYELIEAVMDGHELADILTCLQEIKLSDLQEFGHQVLSGASEAVEVLVNPITE